MNNVHGITAKNTRQRRPRFKKRTDTMHERAVEKLVASDPAIFPARMGSSPCPAFRDLLLRVYPEEMTYDDPDIEAALYYLCGKSALKPDAWKFEVITHSNGEKKILIHYFEVEDTSRVSLGKFWKYADAMITLESTSIFHMELHLVNRFGKEYGFLNEEDAFKFNRFNGSRQEWGKQLDELLDRRGDWSWQKNFAEDDPSAVFEPELFEHMEFLS